MKLSDKILKTMPRIAAKREAQREQILSFKSSPYGKEANHLMLMLLCYEEEAVYSQL